MRKHDCCKISGCDGKGQRNGSSYSFVNGLCCKHRSIEKRKGNPLCETNMSPRIGHELNGLYYIPIGLGGRCGHCIVDLEHKELDQHKIFLIGDGYPAYRNKEGKQIKVHHHIMGIGDKTLVVDHNDGNKLNNTSKNLRRVSQSTNALNKKCFKGKERNIIRNKTNSYSVDIKNSGKRIYRTFSNIEDAIIYRDKILLEKNIEFIR